MVAARFSFMIHLLRFRVLLSCVLFALSTFTLANAAEPTLTAAELFGSPPKKVNFVAIKYLKPAKRVIVPTVYVRMMNWGRISSVVQTSALQSLSGKANSSARSTMEVAAPIEVALVREIADALYADLVRQLRAQGLEVLTHEDIKTNPTIAGLRAEAPDPAYGVPLEKVTLGKSKARYLRVAPTGLPNIDAPIQGPLWPMRSVFKELDGHGLIVTYTFDPVALQAEKRHGIGSNTASTNANASLQLAAGSLAHVLTSKGALAGIGVSESVIVAERVGAIVPVADVSPRYANALSAALGELTKSGSISSKKGLYALEADSPLLRDHAIAGGRAFNEVIAQTLGNAR